MLEKVEVVVPGERDDEAAWDGCIVDVGTEVIDGDGDVSARKVSKVVPDLFLYLYLSLEDSTRSKSDKSSSFLSCWSFMDVEDKVPLKRKLKSL